MKSLFKTLALAFILFNIQVAIADESAGFFILSDKSYSSQEQAQVRLEVQDVGAVHEHAGVDIAVYKVPKPIEFLQSQKNLHRVSTKAQPAQDGVWNSIVAIWDYVANSARQLARQFFSEEARKSATETAPELHVEKINHPMTHSAAYKPLEGYEMTARFRYPLQYGQDIQSADAVLNGANVAGSIEGFPNAGDSSVTQDAVPAPFSNGNVYIPVGQLSPGLYIVEAMLGEQRAVTLLFIGDTVAVTKTSPAGLFVWAVNRQTGAPVANVNAHWTDGVGELAKGVTNAQGWVQLSHAAPEQTYLFAQDAQGGVLISENYYYNSEIYNTKLYATTDHPLYRSGDTVNIKVVGREFTGAQSSKPLVDAPIQVVVLDPNGLPVANQTLQFSGVKGGDAAVKLPTGSMAGGYEIQLTYLGEVYSAAFRVADFQKPHFEINVIADQQTLKTNQAIPVQVQLRYPDGKPVVDAEVEIDLKAQALSMVEGDLGYSGQFPIKLTTEKYKTDSSGNLKVSLPEVKVPSRYILSALATDGAAYRVRQTQELLIERAASIWHVKAASRFTAPEGTVHFNLSATANQADKNTKPTQWKWVRLEDQTHDEGTLSEPVSNGFNVKFSQSGSYTVSILAEDGTLLGATSHWVSGKDLKVPVGHIEVVWDKSAYLVGDTASALVSFSEPVDHALLTLERDDIDQASLLNQAERWLKSERISPQQWRVMVPVTEAFAPNVTFSVAYVKNNAFVFENAGILVRSPKVKVSVIADKKQYAPGDVVKLSIDTALMAADGSTTQKAASAQVALGVVDEMIYVLQPEIAPNIHDFFYHPRRNNVRTQFSQSFIGYDLSTNQLGKAPTTHGTHERATKVLERPRRDDVDTALWAPNITTDANGHAEVSFKMPDALTRWRMTARAMTSDGAVGQSTSDVLSYKDFYIKWTSPTWLRQQDAVTGNIALFNQTSQAQKVHVSLSGALQQEENITLNPGINFMPVPRKGSQSGELILTLSQNDKVKDRLSINLNSQADGWLTHYNKLVAAQEGQLSLSLPADARNVSLRLLDHSRAAFYRVVDDLAEQPYGCVEQTSSRLIPLALAYQALSEDDPRRVRMMRQLYTHRLRLASMAGPDAHFGWWGQEMTPDPFVTTYAYYADWRTAQALKLDLPAEHWERLTQLYSETGFEQPVWQRALMLDWMTQIGLPTQSMVSNLAKDLIQVSDHAERKYGPHDSWVMSDETHQTRDLAILLTAKLLNSTVEGFNEQVAGAVERVKMQESLVAKALLHRTGYEAADIDALLALASSEAATIDRALMLTWVDAAKGDGRIDKGMAAPLAKPWIAKKTTSGEVLYQWPSGADAKALLAPIPTNVNAVVSYDSSTLPTKATLQAKLERVISKIERQQDGSFTESAVDQDAPLSTDALYVEQIILTPSTPLKFMVVEAALPAGAQIEKNTWGIRVADEDMPKANFQDLTGRYAVPVGNIDKAVVLKHLIRFSQPGQYTLPAARAYNMYSPEAVVLETGARKVVTVK